MTVDTAIERLPRSDLEALQSDRLAATAARVYERVPLYRRAFDQAGVQPDQVRDLSDLPRFPFTTKNDLRDHYPFGLFAVPRSEVVRLHASSGTTGKPTVVGYTREDLRLWAEVCARALLLSGARPGQVFQNAYGYGLFTGGLGMHYGAELLGMTVVPVSGGNTARQLLLMQDFGTEVVACTPSYALTLADAIQEQGLPRDALRLRTFVLGAEPWTEGMRQEIERRLGTHAVNIYGLSEVIGPGVSNECVEVKCGSHVMEDHFLPEIVDPQTGQPLPDGQRGELVFTTLTKQALPLIRYRTGDLATLTREPCRCGRTLARMSRVVGRTDDMLIIRGVNVFPSQIEEVLLGFPGISPHYQIVVARQKHLDSLQIHLEVPAAATEQARVDRDVLRQRLRECLGLQVDVTLAPPSSLPRSEGGKLCRVVDQRPRDSVTTGSLHS